MSGAARFKEISDDYIRMKLGWNEKVYAYKHRVLVALIEKRIRLIASYVLFIREGAFDTFPTARYRVVIDKRAEGGYPY